jgi:ankyrin repeat protein
VKLTRLLIEHSADAAAQAEDGSTPLHWASERGHVEVAQLLIKHGADTTAKAIPNRNSTLDKGAALPLEM